jgi:hypothetical protein
MKLPWNRKGAKKKPLPPVPTGNEVLDLLWRDTASLARQVFIALPHGASDEWATAAGVGMLDRTLMREDAARRELARTDAQSTLWLSRHRAWQCKVQLGREHAGCIAAAIVRGIRHDYPDAAPEQVWLVLRDRLRALIHAWVQTPDGVEALARGGEASSS